METDGKDTSKTKTLRDWQNDIYKDKKLSNSECVAFEHQSDEALDKVIKTLEDIHAKKTAADKKEHPALIEKPRGLKHFKNACQLTSDLLQESLLSIKRSVPASQMSEVKGEVKEAIMFQIEYLKVCLDRFD